MRVSTAKPLAALALTGIGSALVVGFRVPDSASLNVASGTALGSSGTTQVATNAAVAADPAANATAGTSTSATSAYANGTWTGTAVPEPWGTFQVQAIISGGALTNVVVVSEPADGHSSRINSVAVPLLTQSAIASDGASVDAVSGATWTSQSYTTSLQSALDQARAAAGGA